MADYNDLLDKLAEILLKTQQMNHLFCSPEIK